MAEPNRLVHEPSPYLRQHAHDPVDWYPWGEDAFARARAEDRPVLLSIGYSTCHWCHVMARESFRDPEVAAFMNREFVNVKVDREERPDVDAIYMAALQAMTGSGGWPLTMALTPSREPFFGGTYFPPNDRPGTPSFTRVLTSLVAAWRTRRSDVEASAAELSSALRRLAAPPVQGDGASLAVQDLYGEALRRLARLEDHANGGLGGAPKFPSHEALRLLLESPEEAAQGVALRALDAMSRGGICDQLGGGFFRYAVDAAWQVPHFEKMLYDNAGLLRAYALAYAITGEARYSVTAWRIVDWLVREMRAPDGAFYSALDAESEGQEGRYYVWTLTEFETVLEGMPQSDVRLAAEHFGVRAVGPVDGASVPRVAATVAELASANDRPVDEVGLVVEEAARRLLGSRSRRVRPGTDDKVLSSWNGLMIGALADAGVCLGEPRLLDLARAAAASLRATAWVDGRLWHSRRGEELRVEGLLEDYAYLGLGLLALYRATFDAAHLRWALRLADAVSERFGDPDEGGYFSTAVDAEPLLVRPKGFIDAATPSENAAAAELVWWAARYRDDGEALAASEAAVAGMGEAIAQAPQAFASSLSLLKVQASPAREVVVVGRRGEAALEAMLAEVHGGRSRGLLILVLDGSGGELAALPLAEGRLGALERGAAEAFVCEGGACRLPVSTAGQLAEQLGAGFGSSVSARK
jgi:uncharacterized protein YyaL (SSP411 family)